MYLRFLLHLVSGEHFVQQSGAGQIISFDPTGIKASPFSLPVIGSAAHVAVSVFSVPTFPRRSQTWLGMAPVNEFASRLNETGRDIDAPL